MDVTLACNDLSLKAHKVVLSACSSYFQKLLLENPCPHPTIIMPQDVGYDDLKFIIEFVYKGEIDVSQAELQSLLKTADQLQIKGLCESPNSSTQDNFNPATSINPSNSAQLSSNSNQNSTIHPSTYKIPYTSNHSYLSDRRKYRKPVRVPERSYYPPPKPYHQIISSRRRRYLSRNGLNEDGQQQNVQQETQVQINQAKTVEEDNNVQNNNQPNEFDVGHQEASTSKERASEDINADQEKPSEVIPDPDNVGKATKDDDMPDASSSKPLSDPLNAPISPYELRRSSRRKRLDSSRKYRESEEEADADVEEEPEDEEVEDIKPLNMSSNAIMSNQAPVATPVMDHSPTRNLLNNSNIHRTDLSDMKYHQDIKKEIDIKFETLRSYDQDSLLELDSSQMSGPDHSMDSHDQDEDHQMPMMVTPELMGLMPASSLKSNGHNLGLERPQHGGPKTWTQDDMELALDALRNQNMSLTKASATYGIPSTTLWQRAHRLGIDTPKKEGPSKSWTEENLNAALEALRTGTISANKASKVYGIPSSTLYKIARREGIRLAAPFNAAPTTWSPDDLEKALESIRTGQTSVQRASTEFGIPTGTLYGRCKREGIELSRSNPTPWSEDAMGEALEAVRLGHMSINQAAIHYNLPYSSLYGRFKRGIKYDAMDAHEAMLDGNNSSDSQSHLDMIDGHAAAAIMMEYSGQRQFNQYTRDLPDNNS